MGRDTSDDEPTGFLEEVFEHRQRLPESIGDPADVEPTEQVELTAPLESIEPEAGTDPVHPGAQPEPGLTGASGVVPDELGGQVEVAPTPVSYEPDPFDRALIDEAMKKSGIVWLDVGSGPIAQATWYVWIDGSAYVLTGPGEQPDPGLSSATVGVSARSKDTRSRLVEWTGAAVQVVPSDEAWDEVAAALAKARLNLPDPATAPQRWASDPAVAIFRITPTGPLPEAPGRYSDASRRSVPVPTPATTAGPPPRVVHRRQTARRPLS